MRRVVYAVIVFLIVASLCFGVVGAHQQVSSGSINAGRQFDISDIGNDYTINNDVPPSSPKQDKTDVVELMERSIKLENRSVTLQKQQRDIIQRLRQLE